MCVYGCNGLSELYAKFFFANEFPIGIYCWSSLGGGGGGGDCPPCSATPKTRFKMFSNQFRAAALETIFCKLHNGCGLAKCFKFETGLSASVNGALVIWYPCTVYTAIAQYWQLNPDHDLRP